MEDEDDPKQVVDCVEFLEKHQTTDAPEAQPFSLQAIAALPLAQRYTLLLDVVTEKGLRQRICDRVLSEAVSL